MISASVSDGENIPSASRFILQRWDADLKENAYSHCRNNGEEEQEPYKHGSPDNEKKQMNVEPRAVSFQKFERLHVSYWNHIVILVGQKIGKAVWGF